MIFLMCASVCCVAVKKVFVLLGMNGSLTGLERHEECNKFRFKGNYPFNVTGRMLTFREPC